MIKAGKTFATAAIALGLLFHLALADSCASLPLLGPGGPAPRLLDSDADFASLGLLRGSVEPWEDGRRAPADGRHFEWWYLDAILEDGTLVVAWFGDNWPYGLKERAVSLEVTPPGGATLRWFGSFKEDGSFSTRTAEVRIGPHSFSGDLHDYRILVDPEATGGLGIDLILHGSVAPWRPSSGIIADGDDFFAWLAAVPEGEITGTLRVPGGERQVRGRGYHDHNWGNISPALIMDGWWWGRATVGGHTVIAALLKATASRGGGLAPLLFIASPRGLEKEAWSLAELRVTEGPPRAHVDPRHPRSMPSSVSYATADGYLVTFPVPAGSVASTDLLEEAPAGLVALARALGWKPWYTRFASPVSLTLPRAQEMEGEGTLEYFEFR